MTTHGIRHGAKVALAAAHLRHQPEVDLHVIELGFPSQVEVPKDIDVRWLIANFYVAANAIVVVVNVEQVIKDTPRRVQVLLVCFCVKCYLNKILLCRPVVL